ncbi:hypothetical protein F5Y01DRAFT_191836 [Xylaria sp. FL0043]|nr:hypothetical protein F5Y01DRAFT_191836 [Xylaria sp. FL0043]
MPRPIRSSCDRCHTQKLKCPKEPGSATCTRCLKAGANCIFSPAGPAWRRSSTNIAYQCDTLQLPDPQVARSFQLDLDWPSLLNTSDLPVPDLEYVSPPVSDPKPHPAPQDHRSNCVRQLSTLAVEIHDVSTELGPAGRLHLPKGINPEELYSQHVIHVSHSRCIEQLFNIAQRLIDIYPNAISLLSDENYLRLDKECQDADCFHNSDVPGDFADLYPGGDPIRSRIDMFLFRLLTACHGKTSDVLDCLVRTTQLCAKVTAASPDLIQPQLHIPELRVGNFVASATSSSSMQATLLVHITAVLLDNARNLRRKLESLSETASPPDKEMRMVLLQCELLEERSALQADQFTRIRDTLTKLAYIK